MILVVFFYGNIFKFLTPQRFRLEVCPDATPVTEKETKKKVCQIKKNNKENKTKKSSGRGQFLTRRATINQIFFSSNFDFDI